MIPFVEEYQVGDVHMRVVESPRCGDDDCDCAGDPHYIYWASGDFERWIAVGDYPTYGEGQRPPSELPETRIGRLSQILGITWAQVEQIGLANAITYYQGTIASMSEAAWEEIEGYTEEQMAALTKSTRLIGEAFDALVKADFTGPILNPPLPDDHPARTAHLN